MRSWASATFPVKVTHLFQLPAVTSPVLISRLGPSGWNHTHKGIGSQPTLSTSMLRHSSVLRKEKKHICMSITGTGHSQAFCFGTAFAGGCGCVASQTSSRCDRSCFVFVSGRVACCSPTPGTRSISLFDQPDTHSVIDRRSKAQQVAISAGQSSSFSLELKLQGSRTRAETL